MRESPGSAWNMERKASAAYERIVRESCQHAAALADRIEAGDTAALALVKDLWVEAELPSYCQEAWSRIWRAVRAADPAAVMSRRELRRMKALADPITVFRGAADGGERGWSWSLDRSVAEDFAVRYDGLGTGSGEPRLCRADVQRQDVIALFTVGGEEEVVIDPSSLDWAAVTVEAVSRPAG